MVLPVLVSLESGAGSPHPRGDGPPPLVGLMYRSTFSPPAWGWSLPARLPGAPVLVLPTRVGMVRKRPDSDGPWPPFSPPAWGWSSKARYRFTNWSVLPTRVGMVPGSSGGITTSTCSPHPRGDGPQLITVTFPDGSFSPPAWGWSGTICPQPARIRVLPTRVGMVPPFRQWHSRSRCSPHPRGDGPRFGPTGGGFAPFSPPAWGWSLGRRLDAVAELVLPTRVGMVLVIQIRVPIRRGSPHPRGDGPVPCPSTISPLRFSPPAWGWSLGPGLDRGPTDVLPTRVGMVLPLRSQSSSHVGSPHPRGDGPSKVPAPEAASPFSPPAWGWSCTGMSMAGPHHVLPTRVGMVLARGRPGVRGHGSPHPRGDGPG